MPPLTKPIMVQRKTTKTSQTLETGKIKGTVIDRVATLLIAAFGLIAALAWNDAIGSLFKEGGPLYFLAEYGVWAYAILVTILAIIVTIWISQLAEKVK